MFAWLHVGSSFSASFLASLVEFVEALTIILAVGVTRGWKSALLGALAGALLLAALVTAFGPALQMIPLRWMQVGIGALLFAFGLKWLRKAVYRAAGLIPLHDEEKIFRREVDALKGQRSTENSTANSTANIDWVGFLTSFKAVLLEGLEVVFIVLAAGALAGHIWSASMGAALACLIVAIVGAVVHKPLARVPENTLKYAVGVLLSAFGLFWLGEGVGWPWPGDDLFVMALAAFFLMASLICVQILKNQRAVKA